MLKETLYTRDGQFVANVLVPPFNPKAEVVVWGSRMFVWNKQEERYYEGLAYHVIPVTNG